LPASIAAAQSPLYCERFLALAEVEGIEDSQVTIVRSSDTLPLTVTVPIAEERLQFPLLTRRKDLPQTVTGFQQRHQDAAIELATAARPQDLHDSVGDRIVSASGVGLYAWRGNEPGQRYVDGLTAAAFLYDATGDKKCLDRGTALLLAAADRFGPLREEWAQQRVIPISHGIFAVNTLRLGWATGTIRVRPSFARSP
jgi:hypothetical protein